MSRRAARRPAPLAALLTLALLTCRAPLRTNLSVGPIELRRVEPDRPRPAADLVPGDWVLRTPGLQVVLAGDGRVVREATPGSILQVADRAAPDVAPLQRVDFFVAIGDRELRATSSRLEAVLVDATPTLRLTARYHHRGDTLTVTRDYAIERGRRALHLRTRVQNDSGHVVRAVRYGARMAWGDEAPFAPSLGVHTKSHEGASPWVGAASRGLTVGWTRAGSADLDLRFTSEMHESTLTRGPTEVAHPATDLRPAAFVEDHELLFALRGHLGELQRAVMLWRGAPVTELPVIVHGAARNPATVAVTTVDGHAVLVSPPTPDRAVLPLTPGRYVAWVTAPGSATGDPVAFEVRAGATGAVAIEVGLPPGASMRVRAVDEGDRALPVRVTVRGIPPTPDPMLGPVHHGAGAGVVVVAPDGAADFPVAPGTYRVTVSHGPEWTIATHDVTVTETLRGELDVGLSHAVPMEGWVACDLHVHARRSFDSHVSTVDRVASLVAEGVDFAAPTEHNVVGDYAEAVGLLPDNVAAPLQWVPAVEVTTDRNAQPWGHFNVYPYPPRADLPEGGPPPSVGVSPREIFAAARVRSPDGIIQVNHPRMQPNIGYFNVTGLDVRTGRAVSPAYDPNYDAIEVFNGFYIGQPGEVDRVLRDWTSLLARGGRRYIGTGSSDSHTIAYQWAGYPRTMVHLAPGESAADHPAVLRALRQGRAFVTSGPMLLLTVNGQEPGQPVALAGPAEARVQAHVTVMAPPWMRVDAVELLRNGETAERLAVPPGVGRLRFDATVPMTVVPGDFVLATARGPQGDLDMVLPHSNGVPYAFTNPVWMVELAR